MGRSVSNATDTGVDIMKVSSTSGFSAGDLVYQHNGKYGPIQNGDVTSAPFAVGGTVPTYAGQTGSYSTTVISTGGAKFGGNAVKLTNGNTVIVYSQAYTTTSPAATILRTYFKIFDSTGAVVVGPTQMTVSYTCNYGNIKCVALSGGGFAAIWMDSSFNPIYAIYSNTGTVVTAETKDTGSSMSGNSDYAMTAAAMPNGGFVIAFVNSSNYPTFRIYNATGSAVSSWTSIATTTDSANRRVGICVRSDNSVVVSFVASASNSTAVCYIYDSTGSAITNTSLNGSLGGMYNFTSAPSATTGGDVIMGGSNSRALFKLNSSNTLSLIDSTTDYCYNWFNIVPLSSGGFALFGGANYYNIKTAIYNSSYSLVTGTTFINLQSTIGGVGSGQGGVGVVETNNVLYIYNSPVGNVYSAPENFSVVAQTKFDLTTYSQVAYAGTSVNLGYTSNLGVNTFSKADSTPGQGVFLASDSATTTLTVPASTSSTLLVGQTIIERAAANIIVSTPLQNGNVLFAYTLASGTNATKFAVYNAQGVLVTSVTTPFNYNTSAIRVTQLPNGKIVLIVNNGTFYYAIYSSSYALLASGSLGTSSLNSPGWGLDALSDNRFVIAFTKSDNKAYYEVYTDAGALVVASTALNSNTAYMANVAGLKNNGGFFIHYYDSPAGHVGQFYNPMTSTTYSQWQSNYAFAGANGYYSYSDRSIGLPNGDVLTTSYAASTTTALVFPCGPATVFTFGGAGNNIAGSYWTAVGATATGRPCFYTTPTATSGSVYTYDGTTISIPITTYGTNSWPTLSPFYENVMALGVLNASQYPVFCVFNAFSVTYTKSVTAGVSQCAPVVLSPRTGFSMVGVATTDCAAGGTGYVQTSGSIAVNGTYPEMSAQSFNFESPYTPGVKGGVSGRLVNMQKD